MLEVKVGATQMNTAVNPLMSFLSGGAMVPQAGNDFTHGNHAEGGFLHLVNTPEVATETLGQPESMTALFGKVGELVDQLSSFKAEFDFELSPEDLLNVLSGDLSSLEGLSAEDQAQLVEALKGLTELVDQLLVLNELDVGLDLSEEINALVADLASFDTNDEELLTLATLIEVAEFLHQGVVGKLGLQGASAIDAQSAFSNLGLRTTTTVQEIRSIQSLSIVSELDGINFPEHMLKGPVSLSGAATQVLRTITISITQTQFGKAGGFDFEKMDPSLALNPRSEQFLPETLEQPQAPTQTQKPENVISTKFANVLVNQVRAVDFQEGVTRFELSPRGLGSIEVEMRTNSDGSLAVVVRAENQAVLNSLREERDLLAAIIADSGSASLDFQEFEQNQDDRSSESGSNFTISSDQSPQDVVEVDESTTTQVGGATLDLVT